MIVRAADAAAPGFPRRFVYTAAAGRLLHKIPPPARDDLGDALAVFAETGRGAVTRLTALRPAEYRLRVGAARGFSCRTTARWR